MEVPQPELAGGEEVEAVCVKQDAFGNNLFQELTAALKEGDWSVGLAHAVIGFVWFGDGNDLSVTPRVMAHRGSRVKKGGKS